MDERLEKAFQTANYMATLSSLRRVALEEFQQSLVYYYRGSSFTITRDLMTFVKLLLDQGLEEAIILDDNNIPAKVYDLSSFLKELQGLYVSATNEYLVKYNEIKSKRQVAGLVDL